MQLRSLRCVFLPCPACSSPGLNSRSNATTAEESEECARVQHLSDLQSAFVDVFNCHLLLVQQRSEELDLWQSADADPPPLLQQGWPLSGSNGRLAVNSSMS